jgi:hypothetical protein
VEHSRVGSETAKSRSLGYSKGTTRGTQIPRRYGIASTLPPASVAAQCSCPTSLLTMPRTAGSSATCRASLPKAFRTQGLPGKG